MWIGNVPGCRPFEWQKNVVKPRWSTFVLL
ncbi:hypothetical protein KPSA3_03900 [Pseudomonas syringae pv. actinidiae]|uniref:Uncharacterized protein n=1 Tax=Pseudomonas syringae pv. actinidiae TaxID=103796 RepID=A0AAN4Q5T9_PSESF|nr:hypothetical protein KPSA3_03900 [Pseudomonas syringae pv. actinidiae]